MLGFSHLQEPAPPVSLCPFPLVISAGIYYIMSPTEVMNGRNILADGDRPQNGVK